MGTVPCGTWRTSVRSSVPRTAHAQTSLSTTGLARHTLAPSCGCPISCMWDFISAVDASSAHKFLKIEARNTREYSIVNCGDWCQQAHSIHAHQATFSPCCLCKVEAVDRRGGGRLTLFRPMTRVPARVPQSTGLSESIVTSFEDRGDEELGGASDLLVFGSWRAPLSIARGVAIFAEAPSH